jgi:hypothetical protein
LNSPDKNIQMVESQIQKREYISETPGSLIKDTMTSADKSKISGSDFRAYRSPSESESVSSSAREGFTSTAKYGTGSMTESSRLATGQQPPQSIIYQSGYNVSTTQPGLNPQFQGSTNLQVGGGLRSSGYEATSSYQASSSSSYQSGTYQAQTGTYQAGTYQPGSYQPGQYQQQASYQQPTGQQQQPTSYQPYQSSSGLYSSSSSLYKSGYQAPKPSDGGNK